MSSTDPTLPATHCLIGFMSSLPPAPSKVDSICYISDRGRILISVPYLSLPLQRPQIAEWVIGTYLMMSHHFLDYANVQKQASWSETLFDTQDSPGLRMGILGYGAIGRQCGRLASAMGMEVYAFTRRERPTPALRRADPASYCLPGTGDPDGLIPNRWFHGTSRGAVNEFLAQDLDVLVVSLPLARDTASSSSSIIGREQFEILARKRTFVSNVARGRHVDTEALLEALRRGQIRGAALDVTDPEPLPPGHPLFSAPNVFITPHVSWRSPSYFERVLGLLEANLEILNTGGQLLNVVDKTL